MDSKGTGERDRLVEAFRRPRSSGLFPPVPLPQYDGTEERARKVFTQTKREGEKSGGSSGRKLTHIHAS
ncbi:hypothetical protein BT69DRAFT_1284854 [Atractiella rhizophila]|nr:hypothetical protein BT69DRAFT_1284854 [Atractiella rhizophila]